MAVTFVSSVKKWSGLSNDAKPVVGQVRSDGYRIEAVDIPVGSTFLETDTGRMYRWTGFEWEFPTSFTSEDTWKESMLETNLAILAELKQMREELAVMSS